ncbi:endonuclease/exonuclease/phosphatase family protein [Streptomyces sp. NPDC058268]|uniref:endonuclease/exonuclease/phosphatase family protein n=1 Tax=Streptomyces sp. NPDC058268 TaxID=3346413 RepID=UPI0036ED0BC1
MKATSDDVVRLVLMNLEHDGGPEEEPGVLPERWRQAYEGILAPLRPDWLGMTELTYSQTRPEATDEEKAAADRRWHAAQEVLGMRGFRANMGQGRNPNGLFVREGTFTLGPQHHHPKVFRTPPANVVLRLPEVPEVPIVTAAFHSAFCSPHGRVAEAYELTSLADKVKAQHGADLDRPRAACWLFGDTNEYPVPIGERVPEIDWSAPEVTDVVHRRHRALKQPDGSWKSCTFLDELMLDCGMHDPARFAALHRDQPGALSATAGYAAVGQGGQRRIDRGYMDAWTIQAVQEVSVIDMAGLSDHHAIDVTLSRRKLIEALRRSFPPLAPWALATEAGPTVTRQGRVHA